MNTFLFFVTDVDSCGAIDQSALARFFLHATKLIYNMCVNSIGAERKAVAQHAYFYQCAEQGVGMQLGHELSRGSGDAETVAELDSLLDQCDTMLSSARQCADSAAVSVFEKLELDSDG